MVIALLTDFGVRDYFVAAMKGVILSINPEAKLIDITHDSPPQDIRAAGFTLRACYRDFPPQTIFLSVVDPGVGSARRAIVVETTNYFFIAPDNGLLSFIFEERPNCRAFELTNEKFFAAEVSRTFHGRDVFAPVAAHLSRGVRPEEFGAEIKDFVRITETKPKTNSNGEIEAEIIHIDHFGNLVTNLKKEDLPEKFRLELNGEKIEKIRDYYAEGEAGEIFMIFGSAGFLEIAVSLGSAAKALNACSGQKLAVMKT